MNELLQNPAVQAALVVAIVTALNAAVAWLKQRFPTQAALVESNWCYIQPLVEAAIAAARASPSAATAIGAIVNKGVADFATSYRLMEGKEASSKEIAATRAELTAAVARVIGG